MTEKAKRELKRLALKERVKYLGFALAIECAALGSFWLYHQKTGREFTHPSGFVWVGIMLLPFVLKLHKRIFDLSATGRIKEIRAAKGTERAAYISKSYKPGFLVRDKSCDIRVIKIEVGYKKTKEVVLVGEETGLADCYYRVGDMVEKYAGFRYPINLTSPRDEIFCPVCGRFSKLGEERCYGCKNKLSKAE